MPVPSTINDLALVASDNFPQGTDSAKGSIDNYFRTQSSFIAQLRDGGAQYQAAETGAMIRTTKNKLRDFMAANDFPGVDPTGVTDCTAALAAFITAAKGRYRGIEFSGVYKVTQLLIDACNSVHFRGDVSFIGAATGTYDCVLEIKNAQATVFSGDCVVSGSGNPGYGAGYKVWSSSAGTSSLIDLSSFTALHVKRGIQIGDPTVGGRTLSEITIHGGYTFGVPNPVIAYGTQTFVNLVGCNFQSVASASFPGAEEVGVICVGANVSQTGGELLHTTSTSGSAVEIRPILDGATVVWGSYNATGTVIECAAPLAKWTNPAALAAPAPGLGSGFVHCRGVHTQDIAAFISMVSSFAGKFTMKANDFQATVARTQANIDCAGAADLFIDDESFGLNFRSVLGGIITAGVPHFSHRMILAASNLSAQSLPNATQTTLKYQSLIGTGDLARFQGNYSAATGIFTVPTGGLKNVQVICQQKTGSITSGELYLQINGGVSAADTATASGFGQLIFNVPQLVAGDTIKIVLFNIASGPQVAGSSTLDFFHILASN